MEKISEPQRHIGAYDKTREVYAQYKKRSPNFIGVLDLPEVEEYLDNVALDNRQDVAVEYLVGKVG